MVAAPKIRCDDKGKQQEFAEKKGKNSAGKVCAGKKSDGGGVVLKMTIVKMRAKRDQLSYFPFLMRAKRDQLSYFPFLMRAKRDQLPYFPFLIESLFFNFFIRQNFFLILSSINFLVLAPFPFGPWSKKKIQISLQLVFKL
jgi:hypothetical protein